jgi:dTMP kinase
MAAGALVAIEGIDQAGKMTLARGLCDRLALRGATSAVLHYPDYDTPIGALLRAALADGSIPDVRARSLLFAANRWEQDALVRRLVAQHALVCIDRYTGSNLAYGSAQGLDLHWLRGLEAGLLPADLTLLVHVEPEESWRRKHADRDAYERDANLLAAALTAYRHLADAEGWVVLDGAAAPDQVLATAATAIAARLGGRFPALAQLDD